MSERGQAGSDGRRAPPGSGPVARRSLRTYIAQRPRLSRRSQTVIGGTGGGLRILPQCRRSRHISRGSRLSPHPWWTCQMIVGSAPSARSFDQGRRRCRWFPTSFSWDIDIADEGIAAPVASLRRLDAGCRIEILTADDGRTSVCRRRPPRRRRALRLLEGRIGRALLAIRQVNAGARASPLEWSNRWGALIRSPTALLGIIASFAAERDGLSAHRRRVVHETNHLRHYPSSTVETHRTRITALLRWASI